MVRNIWIFVLFFVVVDAQNCSDFYSCQLELYEMIVSKSRASIRPIANATDEIQVGFGFSFIEFVSVNEDESSLTIRGRVNQTWRVDLFSWNPDAKKGVKQIQIPKDLLWTPRFELLNPRKSNRHETSDLVTVKSTGSFEFSYSALFNIPCRFDLKNYPFDEQNCTLRFGSSFYKLDELKIVKGFDGLINDDNIFTNGFYFISHEVTHQNRFFAGYDFNYDGIDINFVFRRQSSFIVHLINWPSSVLIILGFAISFISPVANERLIYGSIIMLCQMILLLAFTLHLPRNIGWSWPWLGKILVYDIFLIGLILLFSIVIRALTSNKNQLTQPVPNKMRNLFFKCFGTLVGLKKSSYHAFITNKEGTYNQLNDIPAEDSALEPLNSSSNDLSISTVDPLVQSTNALSKTVEGIKKNFDSVVYEKQIEKEWVLVAQIIDRLCLPLYVFLFSISVAHHLFYK